MVFPRREARRANRRFDMRLSNEELQRTFEPAPETRESAEATPWAAISSTPAGFPTTAGGKWEPHWDSRRRPPQLQITKVSVDSDYLLRSAAHTQQLSRSTSLVDGALMVDGEQPTAPLNVRHDCPISSSLCSRADWPCYISLVRGFVRLELLCLRSAMPKLAPRGQSHVMRLL